LPGECDGVRRIEAEGLGYPVEVYARVERFSIDLATRLAVSEGVDARDTAIRIEIAELG